ncbi:MAG TPA: TAXI family TRAP transporter solute-binding subunit [Rhodocyclaceae bacterium]|nr:TAXI family TRAP transporter solute-binding subunit [Rhodocyclaceae bacterium]
MRQTGWRKSSIAGWLFGALFTAGAALVPAGDAQAQAQQSAPTMVPVLLCPWGCGPTEGDTLLMNDMVKEGSPTVLLPQETPGYMYNIREMANDKHWKGTVFGTEDIVIQLALKWGGTPELQEFIPERVPIPFRLLYGETWWGQGKFFVTFDPDIKSPEDFKGKRIALGLRGQSDWGVFSRLILEHGYGITPENSDIRHLTPAALTQQLIDGSVDVAITAFGTEPHLKEWIISPPLRQLEASPKPLRYIGVSKEALDKVNEKFGTTFLHVTVPAQTLPKQTEPLSAGIARGYKAVHPDFSEDAAYHIVMGVARHATRLREAHPLWRIWSPELMLHGLSEENVHPGAKRAYVELGWWDKVDQFPPVTYPE